MQGELSMTSHEGGHVSLLESDLQALARGLAGGLLWPGHPDYDAARRVWNGLIDKHPGLIVRCANEADVAAAVSFARDHDIELCVRGGGHNVAGRAVGDGALVIDLSGMRGVKVDEEARTVTAEGGALLGDVDRATHPRGLAVPLGAVSETGVAGLTLHGGYGWLSRKHGLTIDNLVSARVVTARGEVLRASARENADLFWAIRGGGGNFGVVTSFEFRLHPIAPEVWFALVLYPLDRADVVMCRYRDFMLQAPDDVMAIGLYWSAPPLPAIPAEMHGAPVLIVAAVCSGPPEDGERVIAPLRALDRPVADLTSRVPFSDVQRAFDEDYPKGRLYYWKSAYLEQLPEDVIATLTRYAGERPSPLSTVEVWTLGGAVARVPDTETAFSRRGSPFLFAVEANWDDPASTEENIAWARRACGDAQRFTSGAYLNFAGFGEEGEALLRAAYGPNLDRLRAVKARYDPDNLFRGNFNVAPPA
ncbi:MAG TPA: FAD-binding oxidoreductase [Anaeromyxobacter sp.]|nr:FAD-binding oxidoreductase [Anaeromyxobacter sp.]